MKKMRKSLLERGFSGSIVMELDMAMEKLHKIMALMDSRNRTIFLEHNIIFWLNQFGDKEDLYSEFQAVAK